MNQVEPTAAGVYRKRRSYSLCFFYIVVLIGLSTHSTFGQKRVLISWTNALTSDANVRDYIDASRKLNELWLDSIEAMMNIDLRISRELKGGDLIPSKLSEQLAHFLSEEFRNQYNLTTKDQIFFFVFNHMHGANYESTESILPWLVFNPYTINFKDTKYFIPSESVYDSLRGSVYFDHVVFVVEACNNVPKGLLRSPSLPNFEFKGGQEKMRNLLTSRKSVFLSSAKYKDIAIAGLFSSAFWDTVNDVTTGRVLPKWEGTNGFFNVLTTKTQLESARHMEAYGLTGQHTPFCFAGTCCPD